ncbi:MAG: hypothetical protein CMO01_09190 [Thalassobius sp.]|nr:hypothetical protein [Thalassovita sp.]
MTKLYELSGISPSMSPDVLDTLLLEVYALYKKLKAGQNEKEAAIAKTVIVFSDTDQGKMALNNAIKNSAYSAIYQDIYNVLYPQQLGNVTPLVFGNESSSQQTVAAPNDQETIRLIEYFADYYQRKYESLFKGKSFFQLLADRGLISKSTTDALKKSSNPGTVYSIPYRIAYQEYINYSNDKLILDAKRLGFQDFKGAINEAATKSEPSSGTNPGTNSGTSIQERSITTQNATEMTDNIKLKPVTASDEADLPTRSLTTVVPTDTPPSNEDGKFSIKEFINKNKTWLIVTVVSIVAIITGYFVFKPKKKRRKSLAGVRRKRRTTRRGTAKRRTSTRTSSSTTRRRRRKPTKRLNGSNVLLIEPPKMIVSKTKPKRRKTTSRSKTTAKRKPVTRRKTTARRSTSTRRRRAA